MSYILETRHGQDDASTSLQIVRSKLVVMLIVFSLLIVSLWRAKSNSPRHELAERSSIRSIGASQRVSVMYVCFSLARSLSSSKDGRPAMSIALSPSGFFASQRVSVSSPNR